MASKCDRCSEPPIHFLRYSGQHLCSDHFLDLVGRRVKKEMRAQHTIEKGRRIGIAVSGGKDSLVVLRMVNEIVRPFRDVDIVALTIDEGIAGYRPSSLDITGGITKELGVEWHLSDYRNLFGKDLDDMVKESDMGPCSICGILRRNALNRAAKEADCGVLVTGHNLDDMAQTVLMNVMQADVQRLARLGPHMDPIPGLIPRSMPLRTTPETETYLCALLLGIPIHGEECPYAETAKRGHYRDLLLKAEEETPGTRHSLLKFRDHISPLIPRGRSHVSSCTRCGEAVVEKGEKPICRGCLLLDELGIGKEE